MSGVPAVEQSDASPAVLRYPRRTVLLVAGIPGAGKSTLINRVFPASRRIAGPPVAGLRIVKPRIGERAIAGPRIAGPGIERRRVGGPGIRGRGVGRPDIGRPGIGRRSARGPRIGGPRIGGSRAGSRVAEAGAAVLDSASIRTALARRLGPRVPYAFYRPIVHVLHYLRIVAMTIGSRRDLVVHECGTRDWARRTLAVLARLRGRPAHLLLLDVPPALALAGQRSRGRVVRRRAFDRHERSWQALRSAGDARQPLRREGWGSVRCLDRREAASITEIRFE